MKSKKTPEMLSWNGILVEKAFWYALQGINISHLGKRKIIFKMSFLGYVLVSWRVISSSSFVSCQFAVLSQLTKSPVENELSWEIKKVPSLIFQSKHLWSVTLLYKKSPTVSMYFLLHLSIRMVPCSIFMLLWFPIDSTVPNVSNSTFFLENSLQKCR